MDLFISDYRKFIGVIFLGVGSTLIVTFLVWVYLKLNKVIKEKRALSVKQARLIDLTMEEKAILSDYIFGKTRTQILPITSGVVSGLVSAKIIYRSAGTIRFPDCAHNIQPWAWEYLRLNSYLLEQILTGPG